MTRFTSVTHRWPAIVVILMIAIVPVVILFSFIERRLIGGLTAGSVK